MLFWPKTDLPENNSGRECCWPYLIGQPPLSPVFGQKRPGTLPVIATLLSFHPFLAILCSFPMGYSTARTITSLCDLPLLFVYFQVNNGVLYYLDYVEDVYIRALSVPVSTLNPNIVFTASNKL